MLQFFVFDVNNNFPTNIHTFQLTSLNAQKLLQSCRMQIEKKETAQKNKNKEKLLVFPICFLQNVVDWQWFIWKLVRASRTSNNIEFHGKQHKKILLCTLPGQAFCNGNPKGTVDRVFIQFIYLANVSKVHF